MRKISLKAFVAGNVLAFILLFGLLLVLSMGLMLQAPPGTNLQAYQLQLAANASVLAANAVLGIIALVIAGYVAARLAGHDLLWNAALAATGLMIANAWTLLRPHPNPFEHPVLTIISWAAPLFALAGGWLAQRRSR
jgi:cellobiose-specific phosphotransferase system component IIC